MYVPIFRGLNARGSRKLRTDTRTLDNYSKSQSQSQSQSQLVSEHHYYFCIILFTCYYDLLLNNNTYHYNHSMLCIIECMLLYCNSLFIYLFIYCSFFWRLITVMYCMYYHPEEGNNNSLTLTLTLIIITKLCCTNR